MRGNRVTRQMHENSVTESDNLFTIPGGIKNECTGKSL